MATSLGYGVREFNKPIPFRAPPPNTYQPDNSKRVAYRTAAEWKLGRPGVHHGTNRRGQKLTQEQRESILLTKYIEKKQDQDIVMTQQQSKEEQGDDKKFLKMAPYDDMKQKYEDPTISSKKKVVTRLGYRYKDEGKKYYHYAFPDRFPGAGKYYDYDQNHKHFFASAVGMKMRDRKKPSKRFNKKEANNPSPGHYKPKKTITNIRAPFKSMGYKITERNETFAPGPGTYNVRSKLRSEKPEFNENKLAQWTPKKKKRKMKLRKKKRKTKSRAETTRSKKSSGRKYFDQFSVSSNKECIDFRRTGFSTFGTSKKDHRRNDTCSPGPGAYAVAYKKRKPMSTRASTVKSTFGVDAKSMDKPTVVNNKIGPGHYEQLDKQIFKAWILTHSAKMLGRQKGWKKVKYNGVPGAGNTGKGKRCALFDGFPGPGPHHAYEVDQATRLGRIPQVSRTCRKRQCKNHMGGNARRSKATINVNPGPGTYDQKYSQTKPGSRYSSMGAKFQPKKMKQGQKFPSPVSYEPITAFRHLKSKFAGKDVPSGVGFAKSGRTKTTQSYFKGPGDHQVRKKIGGNRYKFGSSARFPEQDEDEIFPGPGKYNAPTYTCTAPAYLFKKPLEDSDTLLEF